MVKRTRSKEKRSVGIGKADRLERFQAGVRELQNRKEFEGFLILPAGEPFQHLLDWQLHLQMAVSGTVWTVEASEPAAAVEQ